MALVEYSCKGDITGTVPGEGGQAPMSPLPRISLRAPSMERDGRAETAEGFGSDFGTPPSLLGSATRSGEDLHDRLPEGVDDIFHRFSGVSFGGIPAAQYWADFVLWESLLNERDYKAIIELGTFQGGFSWFLYAQAEAREIVFRTYDVQRPDRRIPGFVQLDLYAEADAVGSHMRRHDPVIVLCDGGNKPRELKTFSTYLSPASTLVVHDWGTEMFPENIPPNVEMVHEAWCLELGSASRVFQVRDA